MDGIAGPKTLWAMACSELDVPRRASIRRVCSKVGTVELPGNRGLPIDEWNQRCGVAMGSPWCAAFVSWAISIEPFLDVRIAGAMRLGYKFPLVPAGQLARAGDLFFFDTDGPAGDKGHIGELISDEEDGEFAVGEGNSRNAVRVVRRLRSEGLVSRPFPSSRGPHVPLPRQSNGEPVHELAHAHLLGTR